MKLLINHKYRYQSQHITMLFFGHVEVIAPSQSDSISNDYYILSELKPLPDCILVVAKVICQQDILSESKQYLVCALDEREYKHAILVTLFKALSKFTGKQPSWGLLTGVRPSKRYHSMLLSGMTKYEIRDFFRHHDFVASNKIDLLEDICEQSFKHIFPGNSNKISLYIGIPFCPSKCVYCSFTTQVTNKGDDQIEQYVKTLIEEIIETSHLYQNKSIQTMYFGGGTPAMLTNSQIKRIDKALKTHYKISELTEYTFEAGRPELIDDELLKTLDSIGVTRICINPQTMHNSTLTSIGRTHDISAIKRAFEKAQKYSFIINADAIVGLMNESFDGCLASLKQMIALNPHNITLHTLSLKKGSKLFNHLDDYVLMPEKDVAKAVDHSHKILLEEGYKPYYMYRQKYISGNLENVGYTKAGFESIYNIQIIEEKQSIIAFGAGATSKLYNAEDGTLTRVHKTKNIKEYM